MHLPKNLRQELKNPLGILIKDADITKEVVLKNIPVDSFIITVGDATTEKLIKFGIIPSLQIVDGFEKRNKRVPPLSDVKNIFHCKNPAAEITAESIETIKNALKTSPAKILVNGEEDLLVLPVCVLSPKNSVVLYGQPNQGIVIVKINSEIRNKAQYIMNSMN